MALAIVSVVAVWNFLPLFGRIREIAGGRLHFYRRFVVPAFLAHAGTSLVLWLISRRRGWAVVLFFATTGLALITVGGGVSWATLSEMILLGVTAIAIGDSVSRRVLAPNDRRGFINLGFGILVISFTASVLGTFGAFRTGVLAISLGLLAAPGARRDWPRLPRRIRQVWRSLEGRWPLARVLAFESSWLLAALVWVSAAPPERRSDGLRLYLPFIKSLARLHHLPSSPFPWSVVIPEAGPAYSATLLALFGKRALRYAMPLCLLALGGIVSSVGRGKRGSAVSASIAVAVASIPIVLLTTASLMNEAFVSLAVLLFAWVAVRSPTVRSASFGLVLGGAGAVAVGAKYTTLVYLAPFGLWAIWRASRAGKRSVLRLLGGGALAAGVLFAPWMWQAWRLVRNPFFPFLSRWIPTRLYPFGLGKGNLNLFHFRPGWFSWLAAPYDLTFHTSRHLETFDGGLGLAFLGVLAGSLVLAFTRQRRIVFPLLSGAIVGTVLLWTQTSYVRYWLPSVWLLALVAAVGLSRVVREGFIAAEIAALGMVFLLLQVPIATSQAWQEPDGLPWDYYAGLISDERFMERFSGGLAMVGASRLIGPSPVVLETGIDSCADADVSCVEMAYWHLGTYFNLRTVPGAIALIRSTGARYWAVDSQSSDATFFEQFGLARELWREDRLVYSSGAIRVFRLDDAN
jgi:hypothetical protein